ncbi:MAG TPA: SulP family inorganic anion transporter, partial [Marinobacterium sp.]|nr:SulP family inorganic anion transporter [Marinobacterium sp.]
MSKLLRAIFPQLGWCSSVSPQSLKSDLFAGLTGAVIVLPQGVAYAFIAGLPPEYGLYTAIVTPVVAALFGSSHHLISGPTAAISIVVTSVVSSFGIAPGSAFIATTMLLTLLAGLIQLGLGLLRLGTLVNFISHTVVIGFTAGAAVLIGTSQLKHILGISIDSGLRFYEELIALARAMSEFNVYSLGIGFFTLLSAIIIRRISPKSPYMLLAMLMGSFLCLLIDGAAEGVRLVGALPGTLPPFAIPAIDVESVGRLLSGAFAVALLGLIEAVSIARSIAIRSGQQIDGNQEFVGQGLSNIIGSLFSCYAGSGSFTRSGANYDAGAKTPLAAIFAALIVVVILVMAPGMTAYLPMPAMGGIVLLIAWNLIDFNHLLGLARAHRNEAITLVVTLLATLLAELEFAIYVGVFLSLAFYLRRTSRPRLTVIAPLERDNGRYLRNVSRYQNQECPQIQILRIDGSLFFGSLEHLQRQLSQVLEQGEGAVLLVAKGVNHIDLAGAQLLQSEIAQLERAGRKVLISSLKGYVRDELDAMGQLEKIGSKHFVETTGDALSQLLNQVDVSICTGCSRRVFGEC